MHYFLDIDPAAAAPIWRQIEDGMRRLVASGRLETGSAVPSVRELARTLRVNPATVSKAYRRLTDAGMLAVRRGEGTFVAELSAAALVELRRRLLVDSAEAYMRVATSVGAGRDEALGAVDASWQATAEGGGGGHGD